MLVYSTDDYKMDAEVGEGGTRSIALYSFRKNSVDILVSGLKTCTQNASKN